MTQLSLTIHNQSGDVQNIAILQKLPNSPAVPLIWFSQQINNTNQHTYKWNVTWGLNWGTTDAPLAQGVMFSSGGTVVACEPDGQTGVNSMSLSYENSDFASSATGHQAIKEGSLLVTTDKSFTVQDAQFMAISVYMDNKPALAIHGRPNGSVLFDTHPTYYVCVTDDAEGIAVDANFMSSATPIVFADGTTNLEYVLDNTLAFNPSSTDGAFSAKRGSDKTARSAVVLDVEIYNEAGSGNPVSFGTMIGGHPLTVSNLTNAAAIVVGRSYQISVNGGRRR